MYLSAYNSTIQFYREYRLEFNTFLSLKVLNMFRRTIVVQSIVVQWHIFVL